MNAIFPVNYGDNFLAKSNKANIGVGINFSFLKIYDFKLGIGYDYIYYSTTDITRAGNVDNSRYNTVYGDIAYEIKILDKLQIEPYFGLGSTKINFTSDNRNFGHQTGNDFRVGFNTDYKLNRKLSAFVGLCYLQSKLDINTTPELISFYDNSKMLQINIGLKIN
ncbi:hypothetical protein ASC72_00970 [Flavobacterium sp. Root420]|nr:hypothetical protein ASC72_00970 [Flavobacterium sp. Root420]